MVVTLWCEMVSADRGLSTTLSTAPHLGCTYDLLNHGLLVLRPLQRHTIRPLLTCTTWTADLRPGTLIDVAAATPEKAVTPSRSLRVLGDRLERLWNCTASLPCQSLGSSC